MGGVGGRCGREAGNETIKWAVRRGSKVFFPGEMTPEIAIWVRSEGRSSFLQQYRHRRGRNCELCTLRILQWYEE